MAQKVLAVDNERNILRLIQASLEQAGYQVITASDGKDALVKIAEAHPDLVVLDVMMPIMNGLETLQAIRANPETRLLPVIMLSGNARDRDLFQGYSHGADIYLTKPFKPVELLTFVNGLLAKPPAEEDDEDNVYNV